MDADPTTTSGEAQPDRPQPNRVRQAERPTATRFDLLILGGGPGGMAAAEEASRLGARVALVLPDGGEQATAAAIWAAEHALGQAARLVGIGLRDSAAGDSELRAALRPFGELLRQADSLGQDAVGPAMLDELAATGVDCHYGQGRLTCPDCAEVDGRVLRFRRAVVVPQVRWGPSQVAGADEPGHLTSPDLVKLERLPARLAILGTGPTDCQWAQIFARLGSRVHLVSRQARLLPRHEGDAAAAIQQRLALEGVQLRLGCDELALEQTGKLPALVLGRGGRREKLFVDHVLSDAPVTPALDEVGLAAAGVSFHDGRIALSDRLRTRNRRIYLADPCCGDALGGPTAVEATVRLCVHNALGLGRAGRVGQVVPRLVSTDPQVLQLGWTAADAARHGVEIDTYRCDVGEAVSCRGGRREGESVTLHVPRGRGRVVGAAAVGGDVLPLVGPLVLLLTGGLSVQSVPRTAFTGSAELEALRRAALTWSRAPHPGWWSRLLQRLQRWRTG